MLGRIAMPRRFLATGLVLLLAAAGIGLYLFQPWRAFTNTRVEEALPVAASAPAGRASDADPPSRSSASGTNSTSTSPAAALTELSRGSFVSAAHSTSGTARVVRLADGSTILRLEGLHTSDGPDVHVYLAPVSATAANNGLGRGAVELGSLKGNLGDQNYTVPAGTDLTRLHSAVLWCKRFSVDFGAADLTAAAG